MCEGNFLEGIKKYLILYREYTIKKGSQGHHFCGTLHLYIHLLSKKWFLHLVHPFVIEEVEE